MAALWMAETLIFDGNREQAALVLDECRDEILMSRRDMVDYYCFYQYLHLMLQPNISQKESLIRLTSKYLSEGTHPGLFFIRLKMCIRDRYLTIRYEHIIHSLVTEIQVARIKQDFQAKVKAAIDKNQKEYILREQLRIIRQELGEENVVSDADEYQKPVKALKADREVKEKLLKEIDRLKGLPGGSQEGNVIRTYIETLDVYKRQCQSLL